MRLLKVAVVSAVMLASHAFTHLNGMKMLSVPVGHAQTPCPVRGSCNLEPGLQGRTDLLLFEDFEESNWQSHWTGFEFPANLSTPATPVFSGSRSVEVRVPAGAHDGASLDFDFTSAGLTDPEEIYFRYYVRFNDSWQRNADGEIGKFPGFDGAYGSGAGHGCSPSNGTNGWSARMMNFDRGSVHQVGFYTYHADMTGSCGEHMIWPTMLERNRWYGIEARVRVNTITGGRGNNDGILQGWIDDALVFSRTNLRFRDVSTSEDREDLGQPVRGRDLDGRSEHGDSFRQHGDRTKPNRIRHCRSAACRANPPAHYSLRRASRQPPATASRQLAVSRPRATPDPQSSHVGAEALPRLRPPSTCLHAASSPRGSP